MLFSTTQTSHVRTFEHSTIYVLKYGTVNYFMYVINYHYAYAFLKLILTIFSDKKTLVLHSSNLQGIVYYEFLFFFYQTAPLEPQLPTGPCESAAAMQ